MTPENHQEQHRFAEIEVIIDEFIEKKKKDLAEFEHDVLWWKERTKKELGLN